MITADDIARYQTDGALVIKNVLDPRALGLLTAGIEEVYGGLGQRVTKYRPPGGGESVTLEYVTQDSPSLSTLMDSGIIGEIAAALMQTRSAQIVLDQVFYKAKGPIAATPWHQDTPFLRVRGNELVRLWFPCDPSPRNLTVQVVRGSHRWNVVYNVPGQPAAMAPGDQPPQRSIGDPTLPPLPEVEGHRDSFDILSWDVEPGDVLAFQGNMLHGTGGDPQHHHARRALAVLLGGPDLHYHAPKGKAFPTPGKFAGTWSGEIPDGAAIGNYQAAFPICWSAS